VYGVTVFIFSGWLRADFDLMNPKAAEETGAIATVSAGSVLDADRVNAEIGESWFHTAVY
jgi:hypothetical protein